MDANTIVNVTDESTEVVVPSSAFFTDELAAAAASAAEAADRVVDAEAQVALAAGYAGQALASKGAAAVSAAEANADAATAGGYLAAVEDALAGGTPVDELPLQSTSVAALKAISPTGLTEGRQVFLGEKGIGAPFIWRASDRSADVTAAGINDAGNWITPDADADGSSGAWQRFDLETLRPEMFGQGVGEGDATADTAAWIAMAAAATALGAARLVLSPRNYLLGNVSQITPRFRGLAALLIEGCGATITTADNGCPTTSLGYNWGQINLDNCSNVAVRQLTFDGNRAGQLHTSGQPDATGFNGGIVFWHETNAGFDCHDIEIRNCAFRNHGNLTSSGDRRGDAIFSMSGLQRFRAQDNHFASVGRWCLAVAEGGLPSSHVRFRRNLVENDNRADEGQYPWGVIDIEDVGLANHDLCFDENLIYGTGQFSIGGTAASPNAVTVSDVYMRRNKWFIPAGDTSANVPFTIGNGDPATGTYRTFERLGIEDNEVIWEGTAQTTALGQFSKLRNARVVRNLFRSLAADAGADRGLNLAFGGHIEGRIDISDNDFVGLGEALKNDSVWYADPSPQPLDLTIERNRFDNCTRSQNLQFNTSAIPAASSHLHWASNRSRRSRNASGEYIDAHSASGLIPNEYWDLNRQDPIWAHVGVTYKP